jgi:hypothetical protein
MRRLTPREQGDIGEMSAAYWLASKGARVYMPFGHSPDVDLIADFGERPLKIQVKTSTNRDRDRFVITLCTRGGNQSWNGITKRFDPGRFDFLFVLVATGRRWLIPATAIEGSTTISVGGPKYSQFEIEPGDPIPASSQRAEPPLDLPSPLRGGAGAGEPGRPVKSVATPEWVRFPPPPCRRFVGRFERTTISTAHQVTIPRDAFEPAGLRWATSSTRLALSRDALSSSASTSSMRS